MLGPSTFYPRPSTFDPRHLTLDRQSTLDRNPDSRNIDVADDGEKQELSKAITLNENVAALTNSVQSKGSTQ